MNRHVSSYLSTGHALSPVKKDGRLPSLNKQQKSKVNTWTKEELVLLISTCIEAFLCVKRQQGMFCDDWGAPKRLVCTTKTAGFTKPNKELKQEYMKFITKMKKERRFCCSPPAIYSIDATYFKKPKTSVTIHLKEEVNRKLIRRRIVVHS